MQELTPKLQETLIQIHKFQIEYGYMPSHSDLALLISGNRRSVGATQARLDRLVEMGYLIKNTNARSLKFSQHIEFQGQRIPVLGTCS
jgi:hypothetical protein